jgi:ribosomal protein L11 methyltransferase
MPLNRLRKTFPLVVANLTADTIIDLSAALGARVAKHGALILSGILNSRAERVLDCMTAAGYILIERKREGQWTTLLLRRQA